MQRKLNNFGVKYGNQENITKKAKWITNMGKELEGLKAKMHIDLLRTSLKKSYQKTPGHVGIYGF